MVIQLVEPQNSLADLCSVLTCTMGALDFRSTTWLYLP